MNYRKNKSSKKTLQKFRAFNLCSVFLAMIFTIGLCSCIMPEPDEATESPLTVEYVAGDGGYIDGKTTQQINNGGKTDEVEAVADEGYVFVIWDDGIRTATRTDENVSEDFTVTAIFVEESVKNYSITYTSNNYEYCNWNGVYNKTTAINGVSTVTATPNLGYRFVSWSDGQTSPTRHDDYRNAGKSFEAEFEIDTLELPVMIIKTDDGQDIYSKEFYKTCKISVIDGNNKEFCFENKTANIRGRGNSTWGMDKKPYKLKFDSKIDLFGNGKAKKWTLIANYDDYSMARNYLAYSTGAIFDTLGQTTSKTQFVDVYLNGRYDGVYLVCEQVETGSTRVDIEDDLEKVTDPEKLGFLIELDRRVMESAGYPENSLQFEMNGDYYFKLDKQYFAFDAGGRTPFAIKSPDYDDAKDLGLDFNTYVTHIRTYMNNAFEVLWNGKDYNAVKQLFDVDSWAEGYIIDELFNNVDVAYSSFYMYKDEKDGKLYRGPIWDYDISSGNCNYSDSVVNANNLHAKNNNAMYAKLLNYPEFKTLVASKLNGKKDLIYKTLDGCIEKLSSCSKAFERNFERWNTLGANGHFGGWCPVPWWLQNKETWKEQVDYLHDWLNDSLKYMLSVYRI